MMDGFGGLVVLFGELQSIRGVGPSTNYGASIRRTQTNDNGIKLEPVDPRRRRGLRMMKVVYRGNGYTSINLSGGALSSSFLARSTTTIDSYFCNEG